MTSFSEQQSVLRKRIFKVRGHVEIIQVVEMLEAERCTGSVAIHMSQGTCAAMSVEEKASIPLTSNGKVADS